MLWPLTAKQRQHRSPNPPGLSNDTPGSHTRRMPSHASDAVRSASRALSGALEPVIGQVYFAPECHANYQALGFAPSSNTMSGVALPDGPAYFTSRGSLLGQVSGHLVASAFGVFNPAAVVPSVAFGWTKTDATTIREARHEGAVAQLRRLLGPEPDGTAFVASALARAVDACRPEGRPLFAGVISTPPPTDALGQVFVYGDALREFRGDAHTAAWIAAGLDAVEIGLLTERYWGLPFKSYVRTRAWSDDQLNDGLDRLRTAGLIDDTSMTTAGRDFREQIEQATDDQTASFMHALGDDTAPLTSILSSWAATVRSGCGYPSNGPQELAAAASRRT